MPKTLLRAKRENETEEREKRLARDGWGGEEERRGWGRGGEGGGGRRKEIKRNKRNQITKRVCVGGGGGMGAGERDFTFRTERPKSHTKNDATKAGGKDRLMEDNKRERSREEKERKM